MHIAVKYCTEYHSTSRLITQNLSHTLSYNCIKEKLTKQIYSTCVTMYLIFPANKFILKMSEKSHLKDIVKTS